jgi:hypothetical protein
MSFLDCGRRGRDRMLVLFTTTCTISAYHHYTEEGQTMQWSKDKGYQRGNQKPYIEEGQTFQ